MAEAICAHLVRQRDDADRWLIDSAGTGAWHAGDPPDRRTVAVCRQHGIPIDGRARQVRAEDFQRFDIILAMDEENHADLSRHRGARQGRARIALLGDFDPEQAGAVGDPYYGGAEGFERIYSQIERSCRALLTELA